MDVVLARETKLQAKHDGVLQDLEKTPLVCDLHDKIKSLEVQLKVRQTDYEKERAKLEEAEVKLREEIDGLNLHCRMLKQNRAEVVSCYRPTTEVEYEEVSNAYVTTNLKVPSLTKKSSPMKPPSPAQENHVSHAHALEKPALPAKIEDYRVVRYLAPRVACTY
ncbi:hypothetical protein Tco_0075084 [Tanacetum coccineum]